MNTTIVYKKNVEANKKYVVNQGGTSSGKTYAILQLLFIIATSQANIVITVVGQDIPNLKKGAYRDACTIYNSSDFLKEWFSKPNQTDRIFTCKNGSIIEFSSFTDEQDAKSGKRDYLFINEADGVSYKVFWQLSIRTRIRVFIDYNPTTRFWAHEKLIGKPETTIIISDHRHNPFLSKELHDEIESIEDEELFKVYARGLTGKLEGLIYEKWTICEDMPENYKYRWIGLDFGFTNDPTAIIDIRLSEGDLWIDEISYRRRMLNSDIINEIKENDLIDVGIVADSAEPKSIAEIENLHIKIESARKGPDSVKNGIDILKRYRLHVTRRSTNVKKELQSYMWKKDKKTGDLLNEPIDKYNHAMDAIRYVALNKLAIPEEGLIKKIKTRKT